MKEVMKKIQIDGKEYSIVFNLNVMEVIQGEYGTITKWSDLMLGKEQEEADAKAVIFGLREMINEGIDIENENLPENERKALLTHKQVGRLLTKIGLDGASQKLQETIIESTKNDEKN